MFHDVPSSTARNLEELPPVFIGRTRELELLQAAWSRAAGGLGTSVMLAGEPGAGKSRLIERFIGTLDCDTVRIGMGWCYSWEGAPAFWPWIQAIRTLAASASDEELRAWLGIGAADIAGIVPELRERLPDIPALPSLDPNLQRFRLLDSVAQFLRRCALDRVVVVALDDLHWAAPATLQLLEVVARELIDSKLMLIGSYRDTEVAGRSGLERTLAGLAKLRHSQRIDLIGLSRDEVRQFLIQAVRAVPDDRLIDSLHARTVGNPFFVREITWLLKRSGRIGSASSDGDLTFPLPGTVREILRQRLRGLSGACREMLAAAAVSGYAFGLPVLEKLVDSDRVAMLDTIDEAARTGIVVRVDDGHGQYRFVHVLIQEALYDDLAATERARLHQRAAQALERLHQNDLEPWSEELAYHYQRALPLGFVDEAIRFTDLAGSRALRQGAWEAAIVAFEQELELLEHRGNIWTAERLAVLLKLGQARSLGADPDSRKTFGEAAELAKTDGDREGFARAALGYAGLNMAPNPAPREQIALVDRALDFLGDCNDALRIRLLGRLAIDVVGTDFDRDRARELCDEAVTIARRLDDPYLISWALNAKNRAFTGPDVGQQSLDETAEALKRSNETGDAQLRAMSYMVRIKTLFQFGEIAAMDLAIGEFRELAQDLRVPFYIAVSRAYEAMRQTMAGEFDNAAETALQYRDMFSGADFYTNYQITMIHHAWGWPDVAQGREMAQWYDDVKIDLMDYGLWLLVLCDIGELDEARSIFRFVAGKDFEITGKEWIHWMVAMPLLAQACWILDERDAAPDLYERLLPFAHLNTGSSTMFACFGSTALYLGLLATMLERWDAAIEYLDQALQSNAAMGIVPYVARTHLALADAYARRGEPGDEGAARSHLGLAQKMGGQLDMQPLLAAARELAERLKEQDSQSSAHGLTPRQIEVLALIAHGMSDREIAEELFISHHTVMRHVHNILNRLGVDSRTAAASYGVRAGII